MDMDEASVELLQEKIEVTCLLFIFRLRQSRKLYRNGPLQLLILILFRRTPEATSPYNHPQEAAEFPKQQRRKKE